MNIKNQTTFFHINITNLLIIDLTFASSIIKSKIANWYINEKTATDFDYKIIKFSIYINKNEIFINSILQNAFNLQKANWNKFHKLIINEEKMISSFFDDLNTIQKLELKAAKLIEII